MQQKFVITAAISGAIAVIFGAFGAHTLKPLLEPGSLENFKTGVQYQFVHTLAILFLASLTSKENTPLARWSYYLFLSGILFFSGSLYLLSCRHLLGIENWTFLGPLTPLGGLCFIAGWLNLIRIRQK